MLGLNGRPGVGGPPPQSYMLDKGAAGSIAWMNSLPYAQKEKERERKKERKKERIEAPQWQASISAIPCPRNL